MFAAGMTRFDAADGAFMSAAYGWVFLKPVRKVFYNLTVTALSVVAALVIGLIGLLGLLAEQLGVESGPLAWIGAIDLEHVGYAVVILFISSWVRPGGVAIRPDQAAMGHAGHRARPGELVSKGPTRQLRG